VEKCGRLVYVYLENGDQTVYCAACGRTTLFQLHIKKDDEGDLSVD